MGKIRKGQLMSVWELLSAFRRVPREGSVLVPALGDADCLCLGAEDPVCEQVPFILQLCTWLFPTKLRK